MPEDRLRKVVLSIEEFPTLPTVVARAVSELGNPNSSAADLTQIISIDTAMTFRILKMANSAFYGFPRAITNVTESIVLLGFPTVRNLMLTTMMYEFNSRFSGHAPAGFDPTQEWRHSVGTALCMREFIAWRRMEGYEHLGYLAALMHDVGKVLFYQYLPKEYAEVLKRTRADDPELSRLEAEVLGADHGQVAAWIVDRWNLPQEIIAPIQYHHNPENAPEQKEFTYLLAAANLSSRRLMAPAEAEPVQTPDLWKLSLANAKLPLEKAAEVLQRVRQEMQSIERFMGSAGGGSRGA